MLGDAGIGFAFAGVFQMLKHVKNVMLKNPKKFAAAIATGRVVHLSGSSQAAEGQDKILGDTD